MTENNYNPNLPQYQEEPEIDIMELISKLWKKRMMIIKWCVVGAVIGLVVGFSIPKTYSASVTLAPETQQKSSNLSGMASMFGVNLSNSVDAISVDMFPDVVHSTPFIVDLFDIPVQFERKDSTINTTLLDYMKNYQKSAWWSYVMNAPFNVLGWCIDLVTPEKEETESESAGEFDPTNLPKEERSIVDFFAANIIVNVDKKTGKTSMSLLMQDPLVVAKVMEAVTENLKTYMSEYRTSKARQDVANLSSICDERKADYYRVQQTYAKFVDANKNVILQSVQVERERLQQEMSLAYQVYSQVASQLEAARIQEQQAKPVFTIIHPVTVPLYRTAPSKVKMLVIFTFLAGCCAAAWVMFGEEYWQRIKNSL